MSRILVVSAGDSHEVGPVAAGIVTAATAVGATACAAGSNSVDRPVRGWDLVVLRPPLRHGRWPLAAQRYLPTHRAALSGVPVAVFGLAAARTEDGWQRNRAALDRSLERHNWLVPVAVTLFDATGSDRDWQDVGAWARKVVAIVDPG
jgi:menaquinone-dependent protoporphyrinogen IX oxidase